MSTQSRGNRDSDFFDEDDLSLRRFKEAPKDLPDLPSVPIQKKVSAISRSHQCPDCGGEARLVANRLGVRAYCGPCKKDWSVSMNTIHPTLQVHGERGLSKVMLVEPDWEKAFEDLDGDDTYRRGMNG